MNIYSRLLKLYRTNAIKTPLEDFTTEILAGILDGNKEILTSFVNHILNIEGDGFSISTQDIYLLNDDFCPDCRVDLVVKSPSVLCFIENKVESKEGYIQLERYGKALNKYKNNQITHLRYCTKYNDPKDFVEHNFAQFRWADIYKFLKTWQSLSIIKEYLEFLNNHNMSDNMTFNFNDLIALQQINPVLKKLDNYLDKIRPSFNKIIGPRLKDLALLKQIKEHSRYILLMDTPFGTGYSELGFGFRLTDVPSLTVWIWCSGGNNKRKEFQNAINTYGSDALFANSENSWIGLHKPLSDFISSENMDVAIEQWFILAFNLIKDFSSQTKELDWHTR